LIIQALELTNFRNIEKAALTFSETFNVIRGKNAQGKTNLLEAMHLFSLGRSFRTRRNEEMIMFGREFFFARVTCKSDTGVRFRIEMGFERGGRISATVNGNKLSGLGEIIGIIPTVIFTPNDVVLASGPPADRRVFIDYTAAQVSPAFLRHIREYRKVIAQRNALLRRALDTGREEGGIGAWDEMLVERGAAIVEGRREMLEEIAKRSAALYSEIVEDGGDLDMEYVCSFGQQGGDTRVLLAEALDRLREQERRRGYTMVGPHYDDIRIFIGGTELRRYGSQGRKRLISIILKLAQAWAIMDRRAERPVVLLDDIFSELDEPTASRVNGLLTNRYQSFITTPREEDFSGVSAPQFAVESGRVTVFEST
jgi:DNA replication and repair protein RecF